MNCLRCGRETRENQAFCDACLESMKKYPVRPGTAVMLPQRKDNAAVKKSRRHSAPSSKDLIRKLRKQRFWLWLLVIFLMLALMGSVTAGAYLYFHDTPKTGQNYAVAEMTAPTP